ncbi:MAG: hypothetical protein A2096_05220 [Spirochaetes bacterium GWF1_41_5]|nr:MAG: hypothetical protein A2096_05220 [Spirochaetes bacterium GWF1_41_5]HBE01672.1 hypothetical protein [Spirochaetia bacterium]
MAFDDSVYARIDLPLLRLKIIEKMKTDRISGDPDLISEKMLRHFSSMIRSRADEFSSGEGDFYEAWYSCAAKLPRIPEKK